jgi:hypothetical protein
MGLHGLLQGQLYLRVFTRLNRYLHAQFSSERAPVLHIAVVVLYLLYGITLLYAMNLTPFF